MKIINSLLLLILGVFMISCGSDTEETTSDFTLNIEGEKTEFQLGDTIYAEINGPSGIAVDSVVYFLHESRLAKTDPGAPLRYSFKNEKLGKWNLSAIIYFGNKKEVLEKNIILYNDTPPVSYTYKIIATYPHSPDAYTQGLEFHNGFLYESTGHYGESSLRKVDYKTGEVLEKIELEKEYFAEGITILNDRIYQLTWKEDVGFIYNIDNLEKTGEFSYNQSKEGWGLANDGEKLYKSDGTEKIWILNKENLAEESYIQTLTHRTVSSQLNELEWVEGRIYANTYQKDGVAIINPQNGAIEGIINFQGLRNKLTNINDLDPINDVLNGIAYQPETGKLFVTGKNWDKLFEVEIMEK